ncbi:hypothetical protein GGQ86_005355 [Xanthobacter flavus]|nr:hypothetical protein [Xanthobacter flavus]MDR6336851.1 hypothetical protein [Xanthobacter flavus]
MLLNPEIGALAISSRSVLVAINVLMLNRPWRAGITRGSRIQSGPTEAAAEAAT